MDRVCVVICGEMKEKRLYGIRKISNNVREFWGEQREARGARYAGERTTSESHIQETKRLHLSVGYYFDDVHSIAPLFYNFPVC